jgi:hypothetical protein
MPQKSEPSHNDWLSEITIKDHHLRLLGRLNIGWNMYAYDGGPGTDLKRPFGNSNLPGDLFEIVMQRPLDYEEYEDDELPEEIYDQLMTIYYEMDYVLMIVALETAAGRLVLVGNRYRKMELYSRWSWKRMK